MKYCVIEGVDYVGKTSFLKHLQKEVKGKLASSLDFKSYKKDEIVYISEPFLGDPMSEYLKGLDPNSLEHSFLNLLLHERLSKHMERKACTFISDRSFISGLVYGNFEYNTALKLALPTFRFKKLRVIVIVASKERLIKNYLKREAKTSLDEKDKEVISHLLYLQARYIDIMKSLQLDLKAYGFMLNYTLINADTLLSHKIEIGRDFFNI
ncbi:hypothetical protein [Helicobacter sp. 11S02629-2]|uniref:hypothetical protein n=1 Tax=Helicobacter sp. 11S02629-2 TaxID=1476195 RepID=UPI000BA6886E|nr:hypothetical protein [Helicobacter sp. 11S02629-2]PAF42761.1 hypothetical protein BKH40_07660 [Helicobacter sp. 11S02629-2]